MEREGGERTVEHAFPSLVNEPSFILRQKADEETKF